MTDVPAAVMSALAQLDAARPPEAQRPVPPRGVSEGDLRVIQSLPHRPGDHRIGMVLRVDSANEFCEVLLVHTAPELSTDRDVVLSSKLTSACYDVVVQTDLRGVVWTLQLGERVGYLAEQALAAVKNSDSAPLADSPPMSSAVRMGDLHTGTPLAGPVDRRWSFKGSEGIALRALASDCTEALLDRGVDWEVNPGLLRPELLNLADDPELLLIELMHWVHTRHLTLADDDLLLLLETGALEVESWLQHSDLGPDLLMALGEVMQDSATGTFALQSAQDRGFLTALHLDASDRDVPYKRTYNIAMKERLPA